MLLRLLRIKSPDAIDDVIKRLDKSENDKWRVKEFRKLKKFRPCVDKFGLLRIEGRLEKSPELYFDSKHPLVLPSRHPLTRLVVLHHHTAKTSTAVFNILCCQPGKNSGS